MDMIHHGGDFLSMYHLVVNQLWFCPSWLDQFDYAVCGVEANVAFTAKRDNSKAIGQAFDSLLAKEDLVRIRDFTLLYIFTIRFEILESEIHHRVSG